jgi:hypothetical protein
MPTMHVLIDLYRSRVANFLWITTYLNIDQIKLIP